jgi:hypothetical protein
LEPSGKCGERRIALALVFRTDLTSLIDQLSPAGITPTPSPRYVVSDRFDDEFDLGLPVESQIEIAGPLRTVFEFDKVALGMGTVLNQRPQSSG